MPVTTAATSGPGSDRPNPSTVDRIASAISAGADLGVFELCSAVAKAREAIPLGGCPRTPAAIRAAAGVRTAFERVASTIYALDLGEKVCPCCQLRQRLDELIEFATGRVARHEGDVVGRESILDACGELAMYAGDDFPDANATREVLERARDVFVAAVAELDRD